MVIEDTLKNIYLKNLLRLIHGQIDGIFLSFISQVYLPHAYGVWLHNRGSSPVSRTKNTEKALALSVFFIRQIDAEPLKCVSI